MKFYRYILIIFIFFGTFSASSVFAGNIYIEQQLPKSNILRLGDEVLLDIKIDSENIEYNAIEGQLSVPAQFSIKEIITGNSFITLWLENPQDYQSNTINFSGITPSGYNKQEGTIFSMILKSENIGLDKISLDNLRLYKNDGLGTTEAKPKLEKSIQVLELPKGAEPYLISISDSNKPAIIKVELVREYDLYDGDWTLVFLGTDKGSGIESFSVIEGQETFLNVTSPYHIDHQRLNKKIYLMAIDTEGNTKTILVDISHRFCVGNNCYSVVEGVMAGIVLVCLIFGRRFYKRPKTIGPTVEAPRRFHDIKNSRTIRK